MARAPTRSRCESPAAGRVTKKGSTLTLHSEDVDQREYAVPHSARLRVENGDEVLAGDPLTEGSLNPKDLLQIKGVDTVQRFLVAEVQKVYRSQGVTIADKHVEIIVRQMLRKVTRRHGRRHRPAAVRADRPLRVRGGQQPDPGRGRRAGHRADGAAGRDQGHRLNTSSFLAAASFQETTRVLTEAAINGAKDHLIGLKENVIIGKLIPAGTGAEARALAAAKARELTPEEAEALREREAAMTFLTGDADANADGVVEADEAEAAAEEAAETVAELMGADDDPAIEAEVTEQVFEELNEEVAAEK